MAHALIFAQSVMNSNIRLRLGAAKRRLWHTELSILFSLPEEYAATQASDLVFVGLSRLSAGEQQTRAVVLPDQHAEFLRQGDSGLIAMVGAEVAGWMWLRRGPFEEAVGCGIADIPGEVSVIRYFEVSPAWRGRGIGRSILIEGARRLRAHTSERTIAFVGVGNQPSLRAFTGAGYLNEGVVPFRRILGKPMPVHPGRSVRNR